jgi:hypothetical protein
MMQTLRPLALDQPALYRIEVQGDLAGEYAGWMGEATIETVGGDNAVTALVARVADQAELHGILQGLYLLGLPLLSLLRLE